MELVLSYPSFEADHEGSANVGSRVDSDFTVKSLAKLLGNMHAKTINTFIVVVVGFEIGECSENLLDEFFTHTTACI